MYKVLMFGDRNWTNGPAISREIAKLIQKFGTRQLLIISGGAPGADQMSAITAEMYNVHCAVIKALWATRQNGAGPQRNQAMAELEPHEAICFHYDLSKSKGSKDMTKRLDKAGIPWRQVKK